MVAKKTSKIKEEEIKEEAVAENTTADTDQANDQGQEGGEGAPVEDELSMVKKELEAQKEANLRLNAEFINFKRRVEKEKADIYKFANEKLIVDLLPIMDNFERAMGTMNYEDNKSFIDGVELIKKSLVDFFEKNGVKAIECVNEPFDHDKHHAVMTEERDGYEANVVIEEFQKGYVMGEKVIRHSMVKVSC